MQTVFYYKRCRKCNHIQQTLNGEYINVADNSHNLLGNSPSSITIRLYGPTYADAIAVLKVMQHGQAKIGKITNTFENLGPPTSTLQEVGRCCLMCIHNCYSKLKLMNSFVG